MIKLKINIDFMMIVLAVFTCILFSTSAYAGTSSLLRNISSHKDGTTGKVIKYKNFALTSGTYASTSDWSRAVMSELGSDYRVADWNDLVAYCKNGGNLTSLLDALGFTWDRETAFVKRSGRKQFSSGRYYFIARHDNHLPTKYSFLVHATLYKNLLDLGSWGGTRRVLAVKSGRNTKKSGQGWEGNYLFEECAGPGPSGFAACWSYQLKIFSERGHLVADLDVDGAQTYIRLRCDVLTQAGNKVNVIVDKYRESSFPGSYKKGDVLFMLRKQGGRLVTRWGKMDPMLESSKEGVFFKVKK